MFSINQIFQLSQKYYNKNNFYISNDEINGFHMGVFPDRIGRKYSEYEFGDPQDMLKILEKAFYQKAFQSFYCSLCAIEEPNNYYEIDTCGNIEQKDNLALSINVKTSEGGIDFLISGTSPQYYYNHLLLSTKDHYSNYMIFENFQLFSSVFNLTKRFNRENSLVKLIFNGNYGSDRWHYHAHITDQTIYYVDQYDNILETTDLNGKLGVVQYKLIASESLQELFDLANIYTSILYQDEYYISESKYLSGVFKTVQNNGKLFYCLFLLSGDKNSSQVYKGLTYTAILPSAILNVSNDNNPTTQSLDNITNLFRNNYYDWDYFRPVKRNEKVLIVENFEKQFRKICPDLSLLITKYRDVFQEADKCLMTLCQNHPNVLAIYKYIISLLFICLCFNNKMSTLEYTVNKAYKIMMSDVRFLQLVVKSEIGYLTVHYSINDSRNLFLKGPLASMIYQKSFKNFSLSTANNDIINDKIFLNQTSKINEWLNYRKQIIGETSARGIVVKSSLKYYPNIEFVIKINKYKSNNSKELFQYEYDLGTKLNNIRRKIPNFMLTLSGFSCLSDDSLNTICNPRSFNTIDADFMILEKIEGIGLREYISNYSVSMEQIVLVVQQIALAILYGQTYYSFNHNDMHAGNILLTNLGRPCLYNYKIGSEIYSLLSYVNCTIIDYGSSHIRGLKKYPKDDREENVYGFTRSEFYPNRDLYTLVMTVFFSYVSNRKDLDVIFRDNNILGFLVKELFSAYSELFIRDPLNYIKNGLMNSKFVNPETSLSEKSAILADLLKSVTITKSQPYWLYLPPRYPSPRNGIYSSVKTFVDFLNKAIPKPEYYSKIYNWGDWKDGIKIGCESQRYTENKMEQIQKLRDLLQTRMNIEQI